MARWALVLLLAGCVHTNPRDTALALTLAKGSCSGVAVTPDTLYTAKHCVDDGNTVTAVNGKPVQVERIIHGVGDRAAVVLKQAIFTSTAKVGGNPKQGDKIRWWGQPQLWPGQNTIPDTYREAYIAKVADEDMLFVGVVCPGDSGSPVFDSRDRLIGLVVIRVGLLPGCGMSGLAMRLPAPKPPMP